MADGIKNVFMSHARENDEGLADLKRKFEDVYSQKPSVYRAPGRVNLIGEHTDYNDGFVFPVAIDRFTWALIAPRADRRIVTHAENIQQKAEFDLDAASTAPSREWSSYVEGVSRVLEQSGHRLHGANLMIAGDVPMGAGLSSSASLEVAAGYALLANSGLQLERRQLARACQKAENEFVGTRCGIMDQLASCCGQAGQALLLDCRSLEYQAVPLPAEVRLVICNTMVLRQLSASAYNTRREECEDGVRILSTLTGGVRALRDMRIGELERHRAALPESVYRRCRHVISENDRTLHVAEALARGAFAEVRQAMAESHRSLRDDFEVSCLELDVLVELAERARGVHGARMTGAGFGGCTINLVQSDCVGDFRERVLPEYERQTGRKAEMYVCSAADGAELAA